MPRGGLTTTLAVSAVAAATLAATPPAPAKLRPAIELRAEYEASVARCRHGHNSGVIIRLHEDSMEPSDYLELVRQRAGQGDEMRHHFGVTLRGIAAKLSAASLNHVFDDPHTVSVRADCINYMRKIERTHLGRRSKMAAATNLAAGAAVVDAAASARRGADDAMVASGVLRKSAVASTGGFWNWGPDRIDATAGTDNAYNFGGATGNGTVLYTIDTGVFVDHEDFGHRVVGGYSIGCPTGKETECGGRWLHRGFINSDKLARSAFRSDSGEVCDSHGTHTASTAAGRLYGVAKQAEIVVVQGLDCNGTASNSMFIAALDWAVDDARRRGKPAVMAMSLGGDADENLDMAAERAARHGYAVVSASGNDGGDSCEMSPGASPYAISVGAIDERDMLAAYSNRGNCTNLLAPGSSIVAACIGDGRDSAASLSGTSMATPHVAGAVLQLLQQHPHYTPRDVLRALDCMATQGAVLGLSGTNTPDRLLHTGAWLEESTPRHALEQIERRSVAAAGDARGGGGHAAAAGDDEAVSATTVDKLLNSRVCHTTDGTERGGRRAQQVRVGQTQAALQPGP